MFNSAVQGLLLGAAWWAPRPRWLRGGWALELGRAKVALQFGKVHELGHDGRDSLRGELTEILVSSRNQANGNLGRCGRLPQRRVQSWLTAHDACMLRGRQVRHKSAARSYLAASCREQADDVRMPASVMGHHPIGQWVSKRGLSWNTARSRFPSLCPCGATILTSAMSCMSSAGVMVTRASSPA